jgi:hypothetical protein
MLAWRPPILAVLLCGFLQSLQLNTKIVSELGLDHILLHCFHFINHPIILKYVVWAAGSVTTYLTNQLHGLEFFWESNSL